MEDLIRKAKEDHNAFAELYRLHLDSTYRYAFSRLQSHADSEDVVSLTWEKILLNLRYLHSNHPIVFRAWIFKILRSVISKHLKKKRDHPPLDQYLADETTSPCHHAQSEDEKKLIQKLILALPRKQQEVVRLRFAADLKNHEIAKVMRISEKTVASNLSRALQTLEKSLKKLQ